MASRQHWWAQKWTQPQPPPPQVPPLLEEEWRTVQWGNKQEHLEYVQDYMPENEDIKHLRILLYGPVGAGKSSFINSVNTILRGRMTIPALASASTSDKSFTKRYETHKIRRGKEVPQTFYPFVFNDVMGLEEDNGSGVHVEDIKLAMNGHVKENHKFHPTSSLSTTDPGYNPEPTADDKVHVLVCVLSANSTEIKPSVLQKMKHIREAASDLGIPQLAIITNIDGACGETERDLRNVYRSKHIKKKMKDFSSAVGIPMNCVFPVKNYSEEIEIDDDTDILILSALRFIIDFGEDFTSRM